MDFQREFVRFQDEFRIWQFDEERDVELIVFSWTREDSDNKKERYLIRYDRNRIQKTAS
jgi:hypothetical protein